LPHGSARLRKPSAWQKTPIQIGHGWDWGKASVLRLLESIDTADGRILAASQGEVDRNLCFHFHRFTVQNVGPVTPLLHGFDSGRGKHGVSANEAQILDGTVLADLSLQQHTSLDAGLAS